MALKAKSRRPDKLRLRGLKRVRMQRRSYFVAIASFVTTMYSASRNIIIELHSSWVAITIILLVASEVKIKSEQNIG